jgi:hypothetical protein
MQNLNKQIARNAECASDLAEMADMLAEQFKSFSFLVADGAELSHARNLVKGIHKWSAVLNRDMAKLAAGTTATT